MVAAVDAQRVQIHVATGVTWKGVSAGVEQRLESQFNSGVRGSYSIACGMACSDLY